MSGQSKTSSLVESLANIASGMAISFALCQWLLHAPLTTNAELTVLLTFVSLARQFVLRRLFNAITNRPLSYERCLLRYAHKRLRHEAFIETPRKTRAPWCNVTRDGRCQ